MQVEEGLLQVLYKAGAGERVLEDWAVRQVLEAEGNWLSSHTEAKYFLRVTDEGAELVT